MHPLGCSYATEKNLMGNVAVVNFLPCDPAVVRGHLPKPEIIWTPILLAITNPASMVEKQ